MAETLVLLKHRDVPGIENIDVYEQHGGYAGLKNALTMERDAVINEIKTSGLRGRGGAGFPAWIKWSGIPKDTRKPHYVLCNADEGEPGTFKDRELMLKLPHMVIEGMIIAAYATQSAKGYIYIRGEFVESARSVRRAIDQAYKKGYLGKNICGREGFDFDLYIHMGAGSYECGEESALMSSLMGERGQPRLKFPHAPLPIHEGVWQSPTLINNVETYAAASQILAHGGAWYATMGTENSKGTKIISVSGHVKKPGNYEVELGYPVMDMIELAGGVTGGKLKAVIPGGSSVPIIPAELCKDFKLDYDAHQVVQYSMRTMRLPVVGSGGFMVFNDKTDIVILMRRTAEFYTHESCGKCTPCREGTRWIFKILSRITTGGGLPGDIDLLVNICDQIDGRSYCGLGDAAAWPIMGAIKHFRHEFEYWIEHKRSPVGEDCLPPAPEALNPLLTLTPV